MMLTDSIMHHSFNKHWLTEVPRPSPTVGIQQSVRDKPHGAYKGRKSIKIHT